MGNIIPVVGGHTILVTTDFVPVGTMELWNIIQIKYTWEKYKPINIPKQLVKQKFLHGKYGLAQYRI